MADRVLRGSRMGAVSYETDRDHDLAPPPNGALQNRNQRSIRSSLRSRRRNTRRMVVQKRASGHSHGGRRHRSETLQTRPHPLGHAPGTPQHRRPRHSLGRTHRTTTQAAPQRRPPTETTTARGSSSGRSSRTINLTDEGAPPRRWCTFFYIMCFFRQF